MIKFLPSSGTSSTLHDRMSSGERRKRQHYGTTAKSTRDSHRLHTSSTVKFAYIESVAKTQRLEDGGELMESVLALPGDPQEQIRLCWAAHVPCSRQSATMALVRHDMHTNPIGRQHGSGRAGDTVAAHT